MNINLDLPPELEKELFNEASQLNLTLYEYILRVLTVRASSSKSTKDRSGTCCLLEK